jgi:DNA repair protein RadC
MAELRQPHAVHRITDLGPTDRPRERLRDQGPQALGDAELLGILLRTGVAGLNTVQLATDLLLRFGGLAGLHAANYAELVASRGIGEAKAAQIKAAIELGRRLAAGGPQERPTIQSPAQAADLLKYEMAALDQEHLRVLLLDTRNRLLRTVEVYHGSLNTSLIRIGEVFRDAVRDNAAAMIVVHNHPSGDPSPSPEDIAVTRAIVQAGKLLDVEVLDHLIIGRGTYVSLKAKGLGFGEL